MIIESISISGAFDTRLAGKGYCRQCDKEHGMVVGYAAKYAKQLLQTLTDANRIDYNVPEDKADPKLTLDYLFGDARGQMFGVLICRDMDGRPGMLKAFSGQYNGIWNVDGWVPPLVDTDKLHALSFGVERLIKRLSRRIDEASGDSILRSDFIEKRKSVSQALMKDIHGLYSIPNFCGKTRPLTEIAIGDNGLPTGIGDCCAPKLLGFAARNALTPIGLAEFYVGRKNRSGTKQHGGMYQSCKDKCERILGHMLCGACNS